MKKFNLLIALICVFSFSQGSALCPTSTECASGNSAYLIYTGGQTGMTSITRVDIEVSATTYVFSGSDVVVYADVTSDQDTVWVNFGTSGISCSDQADLILLKNGTSTIFTCNQSTGLPITLISQNVTVIEQPVIQLNWTTGSEEDNDRFTIFSSPDGVQWDSVTSVNGAGFSQTMLHYEWTGTVDPKTTYVRLKQTDFSGKYEYFDIIKVSFSTLPKKVHFVNPVTDNLLDVHFDREMSARLSVSDLSGNIVGEVQIDHASTALMDVSGLHPGIYFLHVLDDRGYPFGDTQRIVIGH